MKTFLQYKNEIQGFEEVAGTVKAEEKVAAASIHFLRQKVAVLEEYTQNLKGVLGRLSEFYFEAEHPLLKQRRSGRKLLVVIMGDKGLVGGLYHNLLDLLLSKQEMYQDYIAIGKKTRQYLEGMHQEFIKSFPAPSNPVLCQEIAEDIFHQFKYGRIELVDILYPRFVSLLWQEPGIVRFLPFNFTQNLRQEEKQEAGLPIFEPSREAVFDSLLAKYIKSFFAKIFFEARLSEFSARVAAMEHAFSKARGLLRQLKISYFKERRKILTQKQLESFIAHKVLSV